MTITAKFNLVLTAVFLVGLAILAYVADSILKHNARDEVVQHAGMMMEAALAMRAYTVEEIRPLLADKMRRSFLPQSVPSYAATQNFEALRKNNPEYSYKEATLNPTNPRDRATEWESDIIYEFRNNPELNELFGVRQTPTGPSLYLARPIRISNEDCLTCHSTPDKAPRTMVALYGTANGFGWQHDEVVGSQIVSVPLAVPIDKANATFVTFLAVVVSVFVAIFVVMNIMFRLLVIRPVLTMSQLADEISKGNLDVPEFKTDGKDEISRLSASFNRMRISLSKALKMLERS